MNLISSAFRGRPEFWFFAIALFGLGLLLTITVVPGTFTVDENSYLSSVVALRDGGVTIRNTAGLPRSRELLAFDPTPKSRTLLSTPVAVNAPPLYAPLAIAAVPLGWRGLVGLNTLAYLATTVLVFVWTRRHSKDCAPAWLAATSFALGAYTIEYAQGLWPHMLSTALTVGGVFAATRVASGGRASLAVLAGFMLAVAAGVRYQNAVVLAAVGACVVFWARPWLRSLAAYAAGAIGPLALSSAVNFQRIGSWNPISKGEGYLPLQMAGGESGSLQDAALLVWSKVVDYSARPPILGPAVEHWLSYEPVTGSHIVIGYVLKKALLQSAPWAILGFAMCLAGGVGRDVGNPARQRNLRIIAVVIVAVLAAFGYAGPKRHDGLAFNERYLLELLPLLSVAFGWALDGHRVGARHLFAGAVVGLAVAVAILVATPVVGESGDRAWLIRLTLLHEVPLVFAFLAGGLWLLARRGRESGWLSAAVAACLAWGLTLHVMVDLQASRRTREFHRERTRAMDHMLPDRSALVAYYWQKESAVPLIATRDVVIVNPWADDGQDAPALVDRLLSQGRRVFVLNETYPPELLKSLLRDRRVAAVPCCAELKMTFIEVLGR